MPTGNDWNAREMRTERAAGNDGATASGSEAASSDRRFADRCIAEVQDRGRGLAPPPPRPPGTAPRSEIFLQPGSPAVDAGIRELRGATRSGLRRSLAGFCCDPTRTARRDNSDLYAREVQKFMDLNRDARRRPSDPIPIRSDR